MINKQRTTNNYKIFIFENLMIIICSKFIIMKIISDIIEETNIKSNSKVIETKNNMLGILLDIKG